MLLERTLAFAFATSLAASACAPADSAPPSSDGGLLGAHGKARFELVDRGDVAEGANDFELEVVSEATGEPIAGGVITGRQLMPSMGHDRELDAVVDDGGGTYRVSNVVFDMPGSWVVRLRLDKDGLVDEVELPLDVP